MWAKYELQLGIIAELFDEEPELTEEEKGFYGVQEVGPRARKGMRVYEAGTPEAPELSGPWDEGS